MQNRRMGANIESRAPCFGALRSGAFLSLTTPQSFAFRFCYTCNVQIVGMNGLGNVWIQIARKIGKNIENFNGVCANRNWSYRNG